MVHRHHRERGSALVIVLLIVALLIGIGVPLLLLTGTGPKLSGSLRFHEEAFNAAEAGGDAAVAALRNSLANGVWTSFEDRYLTLPAGIDIAMDLSGNPNPGYFRRKTDQELFQLLDPNGDGTADYPNVLYFHQVFAKNGLGEDDDRVTYTAFLINDEASGGTVDHTDALLVVIGAVRAGTRILDTVRLEIVLAIEETETAP